MSRPLLSIAVPTHNRPQYALSAIEALLALEEQDMEIVVSDTSSGSALHDELIRCGLLRDARLSFDRPSQKLDMTGNHNAVLARCRGEYVCLIGDDDTVSPDLPAAVRWAASRQVGVLVPNVVASYVWPDFRSKYFGPLHAGRLYFARDLDASVQVVNSEAALGLALAKAAQGTDGLPKLYHGLIRRVLLEELAHRTGAYVHGSSPDMSLAVGLTQVTQNFVAINYPLTVPGASGGSNTGRSAMKQHVGRMGDDAQTRAFMTEGWSVGVPRFFSVETVWAHAALDTLRLLVPERMVDFNYALLIAACRLRHPEYELATRTAEEECLGLLGRSPEDWRGELKLATKALRRERLWALARRLRHPSVSGGRDFVPNLRTVTDVATPLADHLGKLGLDWNVARGRLDVALNDRRPDRRESE